MEQMKHKILVEAKAKLFFHLHKLKHKKNFHNFHKKLIKYYKIHKKNYHQ